MITRLKVLCAAALAVLILTALTDASQKTLVIGHITDSHISINQPQNLWVLKSVAREIAGQADIIIATGDNTNLGLSKEYKRYKYIITEISTKPWLSVPGNHDKSKDKKLLSYRKRIGQPEWFYDIGDYRLIGINTNSINYSALDMALVSEKTCLVFGHHPLVFLGLEDRAQIRKRFRDFKVLMYVSGHIHEESMFTDEDSGTILVTGKGTRDAGCYEIIVIENRKLQSITQKCIDFFPSKAINKKQGSG